MSARPVCAECGQTIDWNDAYYQRAQLTVHATCVSREQFAELVARLPRLEPAKAGKR